MRTVFRAARTGLDLAFDLARRAAGFRASFRAGLRAGRLVTFFALGRFGRADCFATGFDGFLAAGREIALPADGSIVPIGLMLTGDSSAGGSG